MTLSITRLARGAKVLEAVVLAGLALLAIPALNVAKAPHQNLNPTGDTGPAAVASETVTIVALADLKARSAVLLRAYEDAEREKAAAIIVGGDLVDQNSPVEFRYAAFLVSKAPPGIPVFDAIGNHEGFDRHDNLSRERYEQTFGPAPSWFRTRGVLFVAIDTADERSFPAEQARTVDAILAAERPRSAHAVLLSHVPPFVGTPLKDKRGNPKQLPEEDSRRLVALAEKHAVDLVLSGHYHGYLCEKRGATTYLVSGGGGGTLDAPEGFHHFVRIKIGASGVSHEVVRVDDGPGIEWGKRLLVRESPLPLPLVAWLIPLVAVLVHALSFVLGRLAKRGTLA